MQQYWAKHHGRTRWGVKLAPVAEGAVVDATYQSEAGPLFIWADEARLADGAVEFRSDDGKLKAALAPGVWHAVYEATQDDSPASVETR